MLAAVMREFHKDLCLEETPKPSPGCGEVLVHVKASGLCASDLHLQDGKIASCKLPYIPGHEMAGIIEEVGAGVTGVKVGDHIVAGIDIICGSCRHCRKGETNRCEHLVRIGFERNGSHEEYCVIPEANAFKISDKVPLEQACIIPDAVACSYHSIKTQGKVTAGDKVLILGVGGLGLQMVQIAKHFGAEVYATSRQDEKLKIAKQFGADHVINTKKQNLYDEIVHLTKGEMIDVVFDNIGIVTSVEDSVKLLCRGGKVVVVGYADDSFTCNFQDLVICEKEIIGIRGSTRQDLVETICLVEKGIVVPYIYKTYPLSEINEALNSLRNGGALGRTVVLP